MTSTLIDSNVFLDLLSESGGFRDWSFRHLQSSFVQGDLVLSAIVWAEISQAVKADSNLQQALDGLGLVREVVDHEMAEIAGRAHIAYRRAGGKRDRTLPDFLIGAHAQTNGHQLLTRDAGRYRSYFPDIDIIAPDTHP